jgi:hypothetical protein
MAMSRPWKRAFVWATSLFSRRKIKISSLL